MSTSWVWRARDKIKWLTGVQPCVSVDPEIDAFAVDRICLSNSTEPHLPTFIGMDSLFGAVGELDDDLGEDSEPRTIAGILQLVAERAAIAPVRDCYADQVVTRCQHLRNVIHLVFDALVEWRPTGDQCPAGAVAAVDEKAVPAERAHIGSSTNHRLGNLDGLPKVQGSAIFCAGVRS